MGMFLSQPKSRRQWRTLRLCGPFAVTLLLASAADAQDTPPADMAIASRPDAAPGVTIESGELRARVALPDAKNGFYRGTRFDWSGMITSVTMSGSRFYGPWYDAVSPTIHDFIDLPGGVVVNPSNAATGPAEEFANRDGETVPGYNAAPVGGTFIKIGVGRLRKDDPEPYDHFRAYTIVDGGHWSVQHSKNRITFIHRLRADPTGFGYEYEKTITLSPGGIMTIAHRLRNIGRRPIDTQIYNHNLARFDDADIGPGVSVRFPFSITGAVSAPDLARIDGDTLRYGAILAPGDRLQLPAQQGAADRIPGPFRITGANGATIAMQTDTPLVRTVLWSIRRAVAVEPFTAIHVAPGAEQRWSWQYTFTPASAAR